MDLFSIKIIGNYFYRTLEHDGVKRVLEMAIKTCNINSRMLFHSDRGVQYACDSFTKELKLFGIEQSMSRVRDPWDNVVTESFFHTPKTEFIYHRTFETFEEARVEGFEWIEGYYNNKRLHLSLGYRTPVDIEEEYMLKTAT